MCKELGSVLANKNASKHSLFCDVKSKLSQVNQKSDQPGKYKDVVKREISSYKNYLFFFLVLTRFLRNFTLKILSILKHGEYVKQSVNQKTALKFSEFDWKAIIFLSYGTCSLFNICTLAEC